MIVDDEPVARRRLCRLLSEDPELEIAAECEGGREALKALSECPTDVLFLDVQMPEMDGLAVVRAIPPARLPVIVFVTAFDRYAIQAFELHALDYLMKPFRRERLAAAVERAKRHAALHDSAAFRTRFNAMDSRLIVRDGRSTVILDCGEIDWIEGASNYACVHCGATTHVVRETLTGLEARLKDSGLVRIHRSAIVNPRQVRSVTASINGDHLVTLRTGARLTMSRRYRDRLPRLLGDGN